MIRDFANKKALLEEIVSKLAHHILHPCHFLYVLQNSEISVEFPLRWADLTASEKFASMKEALLSSTWMQVTTEGNKQKKTAIKELLQSMAVQYSIRSYKKTNGSLKMIFSAENLLKFQSCLCEKSL